MIVAGVFVAIALMVAAPCYAGPHEIHVPLVCDGSTDDSGALQDAIDACQAFVGTATGAPKLLVPSGDCHFASEIHKKSCPILGTGMNLGTRFSWDGTSGGTMMEKSGSSQVGKGSFDEIAGIEFKSGSSTPATFLDIAYYLDRGFKLHDVQFNGSSGDALIIGGFVNATLQNIRWDAIGGLALRVNIYSGANIGAFALRDFTYDHNSSGNTPPGVFLFDNTTANTSNIGLARFENGRIEINQTMDTDPCVLEMKNDAQSPTGSHAIGFIVENVTYQDSASNDNDALVCGYGIYPKDLTVIGFRQQGLEYWLNTSTSTVSVSGGNFSAASGEFLVLQ